MKKKIIKVCLLLILLVTAFFDIYMRIEYEDGLVSYLGKSHELTESERVWLREHGPIVYGSDQNSPPLRYLDENSGQFKGMVVDYLRALSIELGVEIEFKPLVWEDALIALETGESDISDMYPSEQRAEVYLFSDPIYNQKSIILTRSDETQILSTSDLSGKIVAVQKGDYALDYLRSNTTESTFIYTDDYKESIALLVQGTVQAVVGDEPVMNYFVDEMGAKENSRIVEMPLFEMESVLAVPKSEEMLVSILNKGIYNLKKKETMEKIYQKWYGISAPFIKERFTEKIALFAGAVFIGIVLLGYLLYSWNRLLVIEVDKRTNELNTSRRNLQTTFDSLKHLMIVLDRDGSIINVNRAYSAATRDNTPVLMEFENIKQIIDNTFEDGKSHQEELTLQNKIYEIETYPMEERGGEVSRILVMAKDVTSVRISEQKLLQSNKMTAVGQLAAGVAHEIRNPLGTIRNFTYILKNDLTKDEKKRDKSIEIIETSVEKASRIIDNLLNFSSISGDDFEMTNLHAFVSDILSLEHKLMSRQNIVSSFECAEDLNCIINRESMKHIIINLISNAVDAMPDGGGLAISCKKSSGQLMIECADTGTGIDEENLENIFNPFFTTKQRSGGTGLGLYLTYNEVKKLDGDITVDSVLGEGTAFTVLLPIERGGNFEHFSG